METHAIFATMASQLLFLFGTSYLLQIRFISPKIRPVVASTRIILTLCLRPSPWLDLLLSLSKMVLSLPLKEASVLTLNSALQDGENVISILPVPYL